MQDSSAFQYIAVDLIDVSNTNPRRTFDPVKLAELAESIREHGIIQPVVVPPKNERFQLVAGERRYLASLKVRPRRRRGCNSNYSCWCRLDSPETMYMWQNQSASIRSEKAPLRIRSLAKLSPNRGYR
jgi:hypothetical protein